MAKGKKKEVKFTLEQVTKAQRGSRASGAHPLFFLSNKQRGAH
jgi:hypothetical protein